MVTKDSEKWVQSGNHSSEKKASLIGVELLKKIIECALISPCIKGEKPISLLIVAKPESGKSSVMKQYRENKGIAYLTDCTAYGITRDILPKIVSGETKTIMIPDLLTPMSKQTKIRNSFVAFLNNLIEEGVVKMTTYANVWNKEVNANIITAITNEALRDARHGWAKMGFLSHFIIFSYSYGIPKVIEIFKRSSEGGVEQPSIDFELPKEQVDIYPPPEIADKLDPIAMKIGEQFKLYGFRAKINFRNLLKCLAVRNGREVVTEAEFEEFLELANYMNFEYNPI
jgi:hypothetical protein